jgi:hypothetical protein
MRKLCIGMLAVVCVFLMVLSHCSGTEPEFDCPNFQLRDLV